MNLTYFLALALSDLIIGFVGGMIGLVLGVVRFPVVMSAETSVSITAGTNLGASTLGAITATIRYHQKNRRNRFSCIPDGPSKVIQLCIVNPKKHLNHPLAKLEISSEAPDSSKR